MKAKIWGAVVFEKGWTVKNYDNLFPQLLNSNSEIMIYIADYGFAFIN